MQEDISDLKPISYKQFMSEGRNKIDKWILQHEPTNPEEQAYRDFLIQQKAAKVEKELKELQALTSKKVTGRDGGGRYASSGSIIEGALDDGNA